MDTGPNLNLNLLLILWPVLPDRWDRPDLRVTSPLSAMEIHIPTGYVITNDVLRGYAQSGQVPNMHHAEMYDSDDYERKVVFFFDHVSRPRGYSGTGVRC